MVILPSALSRPRDPDTPVRESLDFIETGFLPHTCAVQNETGILFTQIQGRIHEGAGTHARIGGLCRRKAVNGVWLSLPSNACISWLESTFWLAHSSVWHIRALCDLSTYSCLIILLFPVKQLQLCLNYQIQTYIFIFRLISFHIPIHIRQRYVKQVQ